MLARFRPNILLLERNLQTRFPFPFWDRVRRVCKTSSPSPHSSPVRDCVAIATSHKCHSERPAKNLAFPTAYDGEILRPSVQDDIAIQCIKGDEAKNLAAGRKRSYLSLLIVS